MPVVLLLAFANLLASSPPAHAAESTECPTGVGFSCTAVAVPLDRQIAQTPTIDLTVERRLAGATQSQSAVVVLAGGPGQAALPYAEVLAKAIQPGLSGRDLIVFDQRGTGASDPLSCPALETPGSAGSIFERCALELGPSRGGFTSEESVDDIEAIRHAYGYQKLVLYGTSYGTKVALEYAERFPQYVEALVLDSVVPTNAPEPFAIPTFEAISPVLEELCLNGACDGITAHPVTDIAHLNSQLRKRVLSGSVYDGEGHRRAATLDEEGLLEILEAGDLNPALRALLPAAVQSALRHDPDPLLRLHLLAEGLIPNVPGTPSPEPGEDSENIDNTLYLTTSCEELDFPWQRAASPQTKLTEALAFLHAQPAERFYPFGETTALQVSLVEGCASWPDASAAPPAPGALPNVPTLILSGAQDLRTPTTNAREVAAEIPDAQVEVVPYTGHSVLTSDLGKCAELAVTQFFGGTTVQPCAQAQDIFAPTRIAPPRLTAVQSPKGLAGRPGKTLAATLDTILDIQRQIIGATIEAGGELPSGSRFGGLHGGYARLTGTRAILVNLSYVPGVRVSGSFPVKSGALQSATAHISGSSASAGTVRLIEGNSGMRASGTLGGRHFNLSTAHVKLARANGSQDAGWPARLPFGGPLELLDAGRR
jgi:pimeloyl-ACP methyl ester carboxylesterase